MHLLVQSSKVLNRVILQQNVWRWQKFTSDLWSTTCTCWFQEKVNESERDRDREGGGGGEGEVKETLLVWC